MGRGIMTLLFIDTNIFLDFYRQVGRESNLSILKHLRPHHDRIITTRQVEMEFKWRPSFGKVES